jgi:hypothetical protein
MYKPLLASFIFLLSFNQIFAQGGSTPTPYPYYENFDNLSTVGGVDIPMWTHTTPITFSTYAIHGTNNSVGLTKNLNNFTTEDSVATLQIGPLTSTSSISFDYRIVDANLYPALPTLLNSGFKFKVIADIANVRYTIFDINSINHTSSTSFTHKFYQVPPSIPALLGPAALVNVCFVLDRGTSGDFWVDIDNLYVGDVTGVNVISAESALIRTLGNNSIALESAAKITDLSIYSIDGKSVYSAKNYENNQALNLNAPGVYFVQFNNGIITKRRKVSVQ